LINNAGLRLAESNEIDDVAEDLDQAWVCRLVNVRESEVLDTTFNQQPAECDEEAHEVASVRGKDAVRVIAVHLFCCESHGWRDYISSSVCEKFGEPFENLLDLLRVWFAQVFYRKTDAYITDAAGDLGIFLGSWSVHVTSFQHVIADILAS
jgi:hypothetical protein